VSKSSTPSSLNILFLNPGDKVLEWNMTSLAVHGSHAPWVVTQTTGQVEGGGYASVEILLSTWNLAARPDAYELRLGLDSNSYTDATRNITVGVLITAEVDPARSFVTLQTGNDAVVSGDITFTVTTVDASGMVSQDVSQIVYTAHVAHFATSEEGKCRVAYANDIEQHRGVCTLPELLSGDFHLLVNESRSGSSVGRNAFSATRCPVDYFSDVGECVRCPSQVTCAEGSSVSDWQLQKGYWRSVDTSADVRKCRHGIKACPSDSTVTPAGDPFCGPEYEGPLCAQCSPDHFMSWGGTGVCHQCAAKKSHAPTIGLVCIIIILGASLLACAYFKCKRKTTERSTNSAKFENFYQLLKVKCFTLFLAAQVGR
jgi:hypothetical protein